MKVIYYVTDHGLGHATRTVAIARELLKHNASVIIRSDDSRSFFKNSLPGVKIVTGVTDFSPVMSELDSMMFNIRATQESVSSWIEQLAPTLQKESQLLRELQPDVIVSDISTMPILLAKKHGIKSAVVSNFVWSDTLPIDIKHKESLSASYSQADLVIKLPFGSPMHFTNSVKAPLVARNLTLSRNETRTRLGISEDQVLVTTALSGIKLPERHNWKIIDMSKYSINPSSASIFVEGQNLINASDFVICKCGYGFVSECLAYGVRFIYALSPDHAEASYIHSDLANIGLGDNMILKSNLSRLEAETIENARRLQIAPDNSTVAHMIERLVR